MFDIAYAETALPAELTTRINLIKTEILNPVIMLLFALATVYFLYGVYEFVSGAGSEPARTTGQRHMISGIAGLVIMIGVYGIMTVICSAVQCK